MGVLRPPLRIGARGGARAQARYSALPLASGSAHGPDEGTRREADPEEPYYEETRTWSPARPEPAWSSSRTSRRRVRTTSLSSTPWSTASRPRRAAEWPDDHEPPPRRFEEVARHVGAARDRRLSFAVAEGDFLGIVDPTAPESRRSPGRCWESCGRRRSGGLRGRGPQGPALRLRAAAPHARRHLPAQRARHRQDGALRARGPPAAAGAGDDSVVAHALDAIDIAGLAGRRFGSCRAASVSAR